MIDCDSNIIDTLTDVPSDCALQHGNCILGRYQVLRLLGQGGSARVYACRDRLLCNWVVALKVFPSWVLNDREDVGRLEREIEALRFVSHEHVAKCYDLIATGEIVGFTMEYLDGGCISDESTPGVPLDIREIIYRLLQAGSGLRALHQAGIIHRDLKPQNILRSANGIVKIVDLDVLLPDPNLPVPLDQASCRVFELNRMLKRLSREDGTIVGTWDYMSLEQLGGEVLDRRTDIYSLGVVAYELLTGKTPFANLAIPQLVRAKMQSDPKPPDEIRKDCPRQLSRLVMRAMERNRQHRFESAEEFIAELWSVLKVVEDGQCNPSQSRVPTLAPFSSAIRFPRRTRLGVWVSILTAALLLVLVVANIAGGHLGLQTNNHLAVFQERAEQLWWGALQALRTFVAQG